MHGRFLDSYLEVKLMQKKYTNWIGSHQGQGMKWILLPILLLGVILLSIWLCNSALLPILSDFENNLWRPAYLLLHRLSPYNTQVQFDGLKPIWFPVIIGLFFPLGALPVQAASNILFLFLLLTLFTIIVISARRVATPSVIVAVTAIGLGVFPSTATHFRLGQVSLFVSLILLILSMQYQKMKPGLIGFLLALSLVKPQLIILYLPVFITVLLRNGGVRKVITVISFTLFWFFVSTIPLFILSPNWTHQFIRNLLNNPGWAYPTLYTFFRSVFHSDILPIILALIFLLIGIVIVVFISFRVEKFEALLWSMALTPVFSPVVWSWDFVLIYPLLIYFLLDRKNKESSNVILIGFTICLVLYITMVQLGYADDRYGFWVPIFLCGVMVIANKYRRKTQNTTSNLVKGEY